MSQDTQPIQWANAIVLAERTRSVEWLWEPWLPKGHLTVLAGEPGVGKSAVALHLAGAVTGCCLWPDGSAPTADPAPVLICDSEGAQAIWSNRIREWGFNPELLFFPGADAMGRLMLDDAKTLDGVRARILGEGVGLVIVDSLRCSLPAAVDENSSAIAAILTPWADLCRDSNIGLLLAHHFGKAGKDQSHAASLDRLRGSSAIAATARSVIAVDRPDPEDRRVRLSCIKSNLALLPEPLGLQIGGDGIEWTRDAPRAPRRETVVDRAAEFIKATLQVRPLPSGDVITAAKDAGYNRDNCYDARKKLRLTIVPDPSDPTHKRTLWSLPAEPGRDLQLVR